MTVATLFSSSENMCSARLISWPWLDILILSSENFNTSKRSNYSTTSTTRCQQEHEGSDRGDSVTADKTERENNARTDLFR